MVAKMMKTQRRVEELQEKAWSLAWKDRSRRRQEFLDDIGSLLSRKSLVEWPSSLKEISEDDGVLLEDFYSIFMFEPPQNFFWECQDF